MCSMTAPPSPAEETRDIWIITHACSTGIKHAKPEIALNGRPIIRGWRLTSNEYRWSFAEAKIVAEQMRVKKLASLRKQIARLETLDFATAKVKEHK